MTFPNEVPDNKDGLELLRLQIMEEVNLKFDALMKDLNNDGSEFSRTLRRELTELKKNTTKEIEEVYNYISSKLVSIQTGQKLLYDPKDGILSKALSKVEVAVKMATDSAVCTTEAKKAADMSLKSAEEARDYIRTNIFVTALTFLGILLTVIGGVWYSIDRAKTDDVYQNRIVKALQDKIVQDATNQNRTEEIMNKLYKKLGGIE